MKERVQHPLAGFRRRITAPGVEPAPIDRSFQVIPRRWVVERTYGWRLSISTTQLHIMSVCQRHPKLSSTLRLYVHFCIDWHNLLLLKRPLSKHTDELAQELVTSTEGKSDCKQWHMDDWGGYERVLNNIDHYISKALTQRLERINGIVRQQTGRWHRRQNKFGKLWSQTKVTLRLVISHFNWIWQHSCLGTTAAQRAKLAVRPWTWNDIATYPTLL